MKRVPESTLADSGAVALARAPVFGRVLARRLPRSLVFVLAYLAVALPALVVAFAQPVWQLTDEAQHADVLAQYAHGVYPVEGRTTLRPETVAVMQATGNYRWSPPETVPRPAVVSADDFAPAPPYLTPAGYTLWVRRHIWWFSYEAMQPPGFYLLATPAWAAAGAAGGPFAAVYAVRVLNCLLLGLLGPLVVLAAGALAPGRRLAPVLAVALTAALPGLLLNGSQVTNDALGAVTGGATLLLAAGMAARGWRTRQAVLLGAVFGVTMLAKLTGAGIALALLVAWLWPVMRLGAPLARQVRMGAVAAAAALAVLAPWFAVNLFVYGHPVPTTEAARLLGAGSSGASYPLWQSLQYCWVTFWTGEHRFTLPWAGYFSAGAVALTLAALAGLARVATGRSPVPLPVPPAPVAVFAAGFAAQVLWALSIPTLGGLGGMTPGRYVYPVLVAVVALLVLGLVSVVRGNQLVVAAAAVFVAGSLMNFAGYFNGLSGIRHVGHVGPPAAVATRNAYAEGTYGFVTVDVDRLVVDRRLDSAWAHIHVRNGSVLPADWTPVPDVRVDNRRWGRGDYASSTPFPETLAPGADYWGWTRLAVNPSTLQRAGQVELRFPDISVNHYRDIGAVDLVLPLVGQASEETHGH